MSATQPLNQNISRLAALQGLKVLDSGTEEVYDEITALTADLCDAPVCLISLVDEDRQWFKSKVGVDLSETILEQSVCAHAIKQDHYLEIPDTHLDPRTIDNALCQGDGPFRFYAGAILRSFDGWPLGTLCVLDYKPRQLTDIQRRVLQVHANSVMRQLEFTKVIMDMAGSADSGSEPVTLPQEVVNIYDPIRERFETLTPREKEVVNLIAGHSPSLSSKQIAAELGISFRTVHHHRASVMNKMKVASVAELISVILKAGIYR